MIRSVSFAGLALFSFTAALSAQDPTLIRPDPTHPAPLTFNRDIRPILSDACFHCHGPDPAKRKADLRLDTADGARSVLTAGKPGESELFLRITTTDPHKQMPPIKSGRQLTRPQIRILERWIREGGAYEPHWAYIAPRRPVPPAIPLHRAHTPLDAFVLARLAQQGLSPAAEAPRETLIRRVTLDLTGLPPTPAEVLAFLTDARPDAYERVVDRLLASPRFGERMTMDWLDSARYADSNGYQSDGTRTMWPWRDWVVDAFNDNMAFDRFTVEQIAGDLLPGGTIEQKIGTGFHRNHMLNGEGGRLAEESRIDYVIDRVDTTATVWLGLTLGCARCHDHKYDPFSQKEYYRLFAYFNNIAETGSVDRRGNASPVLPLATAEQGQRQARLLAAIRELEEQEKQADAARKPEIQKQLKARREKLKQLDLSILYLMVMEERPTPRDTFVLIRGVWDKPGEKVSAGAPAALSPLPKDAPPNRLGLARWLVDAKNPLVARVIVNRYWQMLFGTGLVKTAEDFGVQGEPPTHPELLDWLAVEFRESGWDVKALLRRITTSGTYRQSSRQTPALLERDPGNRYLARGPRFRLSSHTIRDQALALSGLLVSQMGGPPVKPYQPSGIWEEMSFGKLSYQQDRGSNLYRRSLYTFWRRTVGPTNLFDSAMRQVCEVKASRTNTPVHALVTLNDVTYVEAARVLEARTLREGGKTPGERLAWMFRLATARAATVREQQILEGAQKRLLAQYRADPEAAKALLQAGEWPVDKTLDATELASYAGVASLVLNLDEVITKE